MPKIKKTILLVDDNPVMQTMTAKMFKNAGYEVFLAWGEDQCLAMAKTQKPEAILMDVIFPDGDGRDFVKKLKQDPQTKDIPIVFATNTIDVRDDKSNPTITIGDESYPAFAKPLYYPKLLSVLRKAINNMRNKKAARK